MRTLTDLIQQCAQETDRFFHGQSYDSQYCFELFRRAVLEHDPLAWEAVYGQYHPLVEKWVLQHTGFEACGEEPQYFVNRAFEKLWAALAPEKFRGFTELGSLLRYLKMCVHSVISDHRRSLEQAERVDLSEEESGEIADGAPPVEESALERAERLAFWEAINARLNDEQERRVVYGSFVLALKPRELYEQFPGVFGNVDEVYLVKQNVLARLRRDLELARLIGVHD